MIRNLTAAILIAFLTVSCASADVAVSFSGTNLGFADGESRMLGWEFTVGGSDLRVTDLGFQDFNVDGLLESHEVGIWRLSDQALITSAVVPSGTAGTLDGFFRYQTISTTATLDSGTTYVIAGLDRGIDPHVWDVEIAGFPNRSVNDFSVNPLVSIGAPGTAYGPFQGAFGFPVSFGDPVGRAALLGPNFRFSTVPEPSAAVLLTLIGLGCCTRRRRRS